MKEYKTAAESVRRRIDRMYNRENARVPEIAAEMGLHETSVYHELSRGRSCQACRWVKWQSSDLHQRPQRAVPLGGRHREGKGAEPGARDDTDRAYQPE